MARRSQFTVNAEAIQGNIGAEVTFRALKVGEAREYRETSMTDQGLLEKHILSWSGFVDDKGNELPCPTDDLSIWDELYVHERIALVHLLYQGPDGDSAKNSPPP